MNGILKKDLRVVLTGVMIFISYQVYSNPESGTKEQGDVYRNLPFSMPEVSQPSFPDYEVNIRDFGALSDGVTLNTEAINNAIKAVSSKGGGGTVCTRDRHRLPEMIPDFLQQGHKLVVDKDRVAVVLTLKLPDVKVLAQSFAPVLCIGICFNRHLQHLLPGAGLPRTLSCSNPPSTRRTRLVLWRCLLPSFPACPAGFRRG